MQNISVCTIQPVYGKHLTAQELLDFCHVNFDKHAKRVGNWIQLKCPFAKGKHLKGRDHNPSFGINLQFPNGYNCFSCGSKGLTFIHLLQVLGYDFELADFGNRFSFYLPYYLEETYDVETVYFEKLVEKFTPCYNHPYLVERGVDFELAKELNVCYDEIAQRLCFPIYDTHNRCVGVQGRTLVNVLPKYKFYRIEGVCNPQLLYGEQWINFDEPLILVEGVFDVAKVKKLWYNVSTFFGVNPSSQVIKKLHFASEILMLFDNDTAGDLACRTLRNVLPYTKVTDIRVDWGYKDPGEMPTCLVGKLLSQYIKV